MEDILKVTLQMPVPRQAIIWTNGGFLSPGPLVTNFSEIWIKTRQVSFKKMQLKMSVKWRLFCLGLNVFIKIWLVTQFTDVYLSPGTRFNIKMLFYQNNLNTCIKTRWSQNQLILAYNANPCTTNDGLCIEMGPMSQSVNHRNLSLIARFMRPTWGPSGAGRTQVGPILAPWSLLSGVFHILPPNKCIYNQSAEHTAHHIFHYPDYNFQPFGPVTTESNRWLSARLQYLRCISNGDTAVLH